jgi:signal transduction histidine kinase
VAVRSTWAGVAVGALVVLAVTLLLFELRSLDPGVSSGVLYVLGVLLVSIYWGLLPGIVTSVASVLALDFFHTEPTGRFGIDSGGDLFAIAILLVTEIVAAVIANQARLREREAAERARLEEVHASRARVLAAADDERRRVVRDLHDGAQQRLVHTVITLKLARRTLSGEPLIAEALEHAERATNELRELAHGILPTALTRGGLQAGVEALAIRSSVPVTTEIDVERLPAELEATAYFFIAEALTNVAKHAHASVVHVSARVQDGVLDLAVSDDGIGGARADGSGLLGLEDRLAALDGHIHVDSPKGGGTVLSARLPVPAQASR